MTSKAEERKALEQIKAIVDKLGNDSYVAMAFEGAFEIAEDNIGNDFARSVKWYIDKAAECEAKAKAYDECMTKLKGTGLDLQTACDSILSLEQLTDIRNELLLRNCDLRGKKDEQAKLILKYAKEPTSGEFVSATGKYYKAIESIEKCDILIKEIDAVRERIS